MMTVIAGDIDLYNDEVLADPYTAYAELRRTGEAVWHEQYQFYAVPHYRNVYDALHNHEVFSSASGVGVTERLNKAQAGSTLTSDPPYHDMVRGIVARNLTPRALRGISDDVRAWADQLVDSLIRQGTFDAVRDFGQAFPLSLVPDLLGWPIDEGRERLLDWASAGFNAFGPENERTLAGLHYFGDMHEFLHHMSQPGNLRPGSWGAQLVEEAQRGDIAQELLPALLGDYLFPSMDTSVSALSSLIHLFGAHPDQYELVRADPELIPKAFNEIVRFEAPLRGFTRLVTSDVRLGGAQLSAGDRVLLLFASANRDETFWQDDPDVFDIRRVDANRHLGFGHGIHGCVGQALSRLEGHALLEALVRKVACIEVGDPTWRLHNTIRGIEQLEARFEPAQ